MGATPGQVLYEKRGRELGGKMRIMYFLLCTLYQDERVKAVELRKLFAAYFFSKHSTNFAIFLPGYI